MEFLSGLCIKERGGSGSMSVNLLSYSWIFNHAYILIAQNSHFLRNSHLHLHLHLHTISVLFASKRNKKHWRQLSLTTVKEVLRWLPNIVREGLKKTCAINTFDKESDQDSLEKKVFPDQNNLHTAPNNNSSMVVTTNFYS